MKAFRNSRFIKKSFDIIVVLVALIITSPLFLVIVVLIKMDSKGPVFFIQERVGKNGKKFKFLKFRSMAQETPDTGIEDIAEENLYITHVGKFLREWTLDELPQLFNILKGEMSLVGPRPLPDHQFKDEKMQKLWQKRISIKPGLVSMGDAKGRNLIPWEKRFEYDSWYIDHQSFGLDLKILVLVFFAVLSRKGVYGDNEANKLPK